MNGLTILIFAGARAARLRSVPSGEFSWNSRLQFFSTIVYLRYLYLRYLPIVRTTRNLAFPVIIWV